MVKKKVQNSEVEDLGLKKSFLNYQYNEQDKNEVKNILK